ncbi:MAG TPA: lipopolysaccharide kinase InaA family protein [Gemmatimonadales bacterium]|nr:lipopolysaccharide kinase InaA family protein [Gemmatimonadales bacterium]
MSGVPAGYKRIVLASETCAVVREAEASDVEQILQTRTLHEWAGTRDDRRALQGRAIAWAVTLPGGTPVVVRHSEHGGMLAPLTGDRFLAPTRAPHELSTALWLESAGVPTPQIVAYAVYPAGPLVRRSDVASEEVRNARDLGHYCVDGGSALDEALELTTVLLESMDRAGVHHPDMNVKNVLIGNRAGQRIAWLLDVDRVRRVKPGAGMRANVQRLTRSMRRWNQRFDARVSAEQIGRISRLGAAT